MTPAGNLGAIKAVPGACSLSLGSLGSLGSRVRSTPLILGLLCTATSASADRFQAARFEMAETAHRARVVVCHGSARIAVQRTVHNPGYRSDEATWHIDAWGGAVAVALRTAGASKDGAPLWFDGELMEAEADKYKKLTGRGGFYPKDPALLWWRSSNDLALQVFPVLGKSDKTVEYTLVVPTRYEGSLHLLDLPATTKGMFPASVTVVAARAGDEVLINGVPADASTQVKLDRDLVVALRPRVTSSALAGGTLSTLEVSKGKEMTGRGSSAVSAASWAATFRSSPWSAKRRDTRRTCSCSSTPRRSAPMPS